MEEEPKALIMDNLGAHLSQSVMERCHDYNIRYWYGMVPTGTYWFCTVPTLPTYLPVRSVTGTGTCLRYPGTICRILKQLVKCS